MMKVLMAAIKLFRKVQLRHQKSSYKLQHPRSIAQPYIMGSAATWPSHGPRSLYASVQIRSTPNHNARMLQLAADDRDRSF